MRQFPLLALTFAGFLALTGCASSSYTVPGGPASFEAMGISADAKAALSDKTVRDALDKKPLASFPATIAVARVQAADYSSYDANRGEHQHGAYAVITRRDMETDQDIAEIVKLPQVRGVVAMKRVLLDRNLNTDLELRVAAAKLHADMLLIYTFDTTFYTNTAVRPLSVISLGLFPNKDAKVTSTASALLMDVNNGYLYSVSEATSSDHQLANAWGSDDAIDEVRRRTEREAFTKLLAAFKTEWPNVVTQYAPAR